MVMITCQIKRKEKKEGEKGSNYVIANSKKEAEIQIKIILEEIIAYHEARIKTLNKHIETIK